MFKFKKVDEDDLDIISQIRGYYSTADKSFAYLRGGTTGQDILTFPHSTYTISLPDLLNSQQPHPNLTGIRVIDASQSNFNFIYDINKSTEGSYPQLFENRELLSDYEKAFGNILGTELEEKGYEVRTLKIPALHVEALWLHKDENPSEDIYYPVRMIDEKFQHDTFYSTTDFFTILRRLAEGNATDDIPGKEGMKGG